jgi:hypothetical protein
MRSTRRDALKALGVTLAVVTVGGVETLARADARQANLRRRTDRPFADLKGAQFASSTVKSVGAVEDGSIPVTLVDAQGHSFVVEVLRHDPSSPPSVARAGSLAVYMKVGRGQRVTREEHGLATMALAAELARREALGAPVPSLASLTERAAFRTTRSAAAPPPPLRTA